MATKDNQTPPGQGERRAQRGYVSQYDAAAAAIRAALSRGELIWVGVADRSAGVADDVVLGMADRVVGHQFKTSNFPEPFRLETLLTGSDGLLRPMVDAWRQLERSCGGQLVEVRLITTDYPSTSDRLAEGANGHSAALVRELELNPGRTLAEWRTTRWSAIINRLAEASGVDDADFHRFLNAFRLMAGPAADFVEAHRLSPDAAREVRQIAAVLSRLVADPRDRDRWTRAELLDELEWRDGFGLRRSHRFPVGVHVQRNEVTERALRDAIARAVNGYVAVLGPPGSGKSTLLQSTIVAEPGFVVLRYLAFVPGDAQGLGRGEAADFLDDVNTQLKGSGLEVSRFRDIDLADKRQHLEKLLAAAGERFRGSGLRTLIVVDGLDHVPREERYAHSMLAELPLPTAVPDGVTIVLGSQRLDLAELRPAIRLQAESSSRCVQMAPLSREAVALMADVSGLDSAVPRERLYELSQGHPLATRYLIEAIRLAGDQRRASLLAGEMTFGGDIEVVYAAAWRGVEGDSEAREVLEYIARAEGPIQPELLSEATSEAAVERALRSTRHLLDISQIGGWSMFHNSFRLFVLERPPLRFGRPDPDYGPRIYRRLSQLARTHPKAGAQRWLELRYLARASDQQRVLDLAKAERFRTELAEGRRKVDLTSDIRLSFGAVLKVGNALELFRMLLIQDEVDRRAASLEYASTIEVALVAVGDLQAAEAYVDSYQRGGYIVVDALLEAREVGRARALFDRIEPVGRLAAGDPGSHYRRQELWDWTRRVHWFRESDQIREAVARLADAAARTREADPSVLSRSLRLAIARSVMSIEPFTDPERMLLEFELDSEELPALLAEAALAAHRARDKRATELLSRTLAQLHFATLPDEWRRALALAALDLGLEPSAQGLFAGLIPPAVATLDSATDEEAAADVVKAVLNYAELATSLGRPLAKAPLSRRGLLRPLQYHAEAAGVLLAQSAKPGELVSGTVKRATISALRFLEQAQASENDEFYAAMQVARAAPVLARALIQAAARFGPAELENVVAAFDSAFAISETRNEHRLELRRTVALELYRATGDAEGARIRLQSLIDWTREQTPEQQVEALAKLSSAFAAVGDDHQAMAMLRRVHEETLGYSLPPKKDGQYNQWIELMQRANAVDPIRRGERVALMMRQIAGMAMTEGAAAAKRLSAKTLVEAVLVDAATGISVASALVSDSLITWDALVNALLLGLVRRRPDMSAVCAVVWCSLVLPFYAEPYYVASRTGEFIDAVLDTVRTDDVDLVLVLLRDAIAAESRIDIRAKLSARLMAAAERRGVGGDYIKEFDRRWREEAPPEKYKSTALEYDDLTSLTNLEAATSGSEKTGPNFAHAFARLVPNANFEQAQRIFANRADLQGDAGARFALLRRALTEGDAAFARELADGYRNNMQEWDGWSRWTGATKRRWFEYRLQLEGRGVYREAFADLAGALAAGREYGQSILWDVDDVFPVIAEAPDWPGMWEMQAEQLKQTREHAIGSPFEFRMDVTTDEELVVALQRWALSLGAVELIHHVRVSALRLRKVAGGEAIFVRLLRTLLRGPEDHALEGLILLSQEPAASVPDGLVGEVGSLVDHPDFLVAVLAERLSRRSGLSARTISAELPAFYRIVLDDDGASDFAPPWSKDPETGAMIVEDPLGWTYAMPQMIRALARNGITMAQIRHRCAMLIAGWGGLETFGKAATERMQADLGRVEMRLAFIRPHMAGAMRALRHVAGELRRAALTGDENYLLHLLDCPPVGIPIVSPIERPWWVARPSVEDSFREEETWLDAVESDVRSLDTGDATLVAAVQCFERRDVRGRLKAETMTLPDGAALEGDSADQWYETIPKAAWIDGVVALSYVGKWVMTV